MMNYPTGRWSIFRFEGFWVADSQDHNGTHATADSWESLLQNMIQAEQIYWDKMAYKPNHRK